MKKKLFILVLVLAAMTTYGENGQNLNYGNIDVRTHYQALEEISYDSELIVEVELTGKNQIIHYGNAEFNIIEAQVHNVIKGDRQLSSNFIPIIQIAAFSRNDHKNYLLFLEKYTGPITNDAYVNAGVYQGTFRIGKNNKLVYDAGQYGGHKSFQPDLEGLDMKAVEVKVQQAIKNERPPKKRGQMSNDR